MVYVSGRWDVHPRPRAGAVSWCTGICPGQRLFRVGPIWRRSSILGVAGVTLSVDASETLAIVGESGSGKTTLARNQRIATACRG
ncbi:MAG: ATP-binding cassette domain-containing protein [Gammaproteobacteria bacterium]|nr:ATP-binding cassette domain-containing protein [Gammaproteobacteria bacterium]